MSARGLALSLLVEIETKRAFTNLALASLPSELAGRDRALVTELVAGTTRRRRTLDHALDQLLQKPIANLSPPIRNNLTMGAYQILYLSRIPARAAVDEAVKLARKHGQEGMARLTNAVLRKLASSGLEGVRWPEDPAERLAVEESYPDWLIARWVADHGLAGAAELARAQNQPPPLCLRANRLKIGRDELVAKLGEAGIEAQPSPVAPEGVRIPSGAIASLPGFEAGWWYVQGEGAMLAARAVDPRPGQIVADIGAAPGGKATHLAELMGDQGKILALDPHPGRLALVEANSRRLGLTSIVPVLQDARQPLGTPVDRALVDAPCSGLGTLYRKADLRWRARPEEVAELARLQREILEAVAPAIAPGGALVYATCTIGRQENEDVVRGFLSGHPEFELADLSSALPGSWAEQARAGMIQLLPHRHGTEGFFIARLARSAAIE